VYKQALRIAPREKGILLNLGLVYLKQDDYALALPYFRRLHGQDPDNLQATNLLATCLVYGGQSAAALELLKPLAGTKGDPATLYLLGVAYSRTGEKEAGEKVFATLFEDAGTKAQANFLVGKAYYDSARFAEAEQAFKEAEGADPRLRGVHLELAKVYISLRRYEEARKSLAWALQMEPSALPMPTAADAGPIIKSSWFDLFKYPRSLIVSWLGNAGAQTGVYGITLWAPSLFVLLLKATPQEAAKMMILLSVSGFIGRLSFSYFSEALGRRTAGGLLGLGAGILTIVAGYNYDTTLFGLSAFWLILAVAFFFADGGFAIVGPYAAEVWPSHLRTTGMGSAYGFGGIGKIIGPVGLALIVGSNNYLKPDVPLTQIPTAFIYLGCWFLMAGLVYYFIGFETRGKSIEQIDKELADGLDLSTAQVRQA